MFRSRALAMRRSMLMVLMIVSAIELMLAAGASAQLPPQSVTRVSVAADGTQANGDSGPAAAITADGRFVAFASAASNLVTGDTNNSIDVFVKDRQTGAIVRVSVASDGTERTGDSGVEGVDLTDDANIIVFTSRAALVADDTNTCTAPASSGAGPSCPDIYLHNRALGQTVRISIANGGGNADGASRQPVISGVTGRFASFASDATNLTSISDANGHTDVFLHDRDTSTTGRVSVSTGGGEANGASFSPAISGSGETIAFLSDATPATLGAGADPLLCPATGPCTRAYTRVRATGVTALVPVIDPMSYAGGHRVDTVELSGNGRLVAVALVRVTTVLGATVWGGGVLYDLQTGTGTPWNAGIISGDGRHVGGRTDILDLNTGWFSIHDRVTWVTEDAVPYDLLHSPVLSPELSGDGRFMVFSSPASNRVPNDTNGADVFVVDRDQDNDGMFSVWEHLFGLDPANGADATLDPDGDGLTNVQEYATAGHPTGSHKYYFAEGAENGFMRTSFAAVNIGTARALVRMHYQSSDSPNVFEFRSIEANAKDIIYPSLPPNNFATLVESDQPLVMNRQMIWGDSPQGQYLGSHMESAIAGPSRTWYLAEGATHGSFDLFYLLQNSTDTEAQVSVEYLRPAPLPPIVKTYSVAPRSRRTIWVDDEGPELAETDVSATITSDQPLVVERAMYYSTPGQSWIAGHAGAGVTAPATRWFVAEGATGAFFDFYVLIANPGSAAADLTVTYLLQDGPPITKTYTVAARSRRTIDVKGEDPRLASADVSTIVESTNGQPVIVERALWWPSGQWHEAHLSAGATETGTKWGFAGQTTLLLNNDMYLLIANTSNSAGTATIKILPCGLAPCREVVVPLPANSRVTVQTSAWLPLLGTNTYQGTFGGIIEADVPIVVEQANYTTSGGRVWELGSSALATKLQ
jgi:hypothetical protein